ncbi:MAG: 2-phosphosulfolactate phosphatase, partial [Pedosphaera parvula]|nr:2-phosphosulfolactate phosphatase [Pedosphaera parvula]
AGRDLSHCVCVVFDILRATTTMVTALANGAEAIIPVSEISEAVAIRAKRPEVLLAGEREGVRIRAAQTGGPDFDLGNSPREFTTGRVAGRTIVMTTTNGTRALRACAGAKTILIGAFLNLATIANWIKHNRPENLLLVCAGTGEQAAYEDALAAGALCDLVWETYAAEQMADSALIAREIYRPAQSDLLGAIQGSRNGRRLLAIPELRDDVPLCARRDTCDLLAVMHSSGEVRKG